MPSQTFVTQVAAGATVNILQGQRIARIDPRYRIANFNVAAVVEDPQLSVAVFVGTDNPIMPTVPNVDATFGAVNFRDDTIGGFRVQGGDEVTMQVTNADAVNPLSIRTLINVG